MNRMDPEDVKYLARETARQLGATIRPHWMRTIGIVMWRIAVLLALAFIGAVTWVSAQHAAEQNDREFRRDLQHIGDRFEDQIRGAH